jgi:hypothetical protein
MHYAGCSAVSFRFDGLVNCELMTKLSGFYPYRKRCIENTVLRKVCEPKGEEFKRKHTKFLLRDSILLPFTNSFKIFV